MIDGISAVTLATHDMQRAVRFYRALGFDILYGGEASSFTSFQAGTGYLNLTVQSDQTRWSWWGRVIFYVADVNAFYDRALAAGCPSLCPAMPNGGNGTFISPTPMDTSSVSRGRCPLRHNSSATRTAG